jgi:DNA-binding beta-propeller fold protein YncE
VADTGNSRVQKRDAQGNWTVLAERGSEVGRVTTPCSISIDKAGNLYVAENDAIYEGISLNRIQVRDAKGRWDALPGVGSGASQLDKPYGLVVDPAGDVYVADVGTGRLHRYRPPK